MTFIRNVLKRDLYLINNLEELKEKKNPKSKMVIILDNSIEDELLERNIIYLYRLGIRYFQFLVVPH